MESAEAGKISLPYCYCLAIACYGADPFFQSCKRDLSAFLGTIENTNLPELRFRVLLTDGVREVGAVCRL